MLVIIRVLSELNVFCCLRMFQRLCFVERYLAILSCNHLDQDSHLHLPPHYWNYTRNLIINWNVVFVAQLAQTPEQTWVLNWTKNFNNKLGDRVFRDSHFKPILVLSLRIPWFDQKRKILTFDNWIKFYLVFKIKLSIKPPQFKWSKFWIIQLFMKSGDWFLPWIIPSQK